MCKDLVDAELVGARWVDAGLVGECWTSSTAATKDTVAESGVTRAECRFREREYFGKQTCGFLKKICCAVVIRGPVSADIRKLV